MGSIRPARSSGAVIARPSPRSRGDYLARHVQAEPAALRRPGRADAAGPHPAALGRPPDPDRSRSATRSTWSTTSPPARRTWPTGSRAWPSRLFSWALERGIVDANPLVGLRRAGEGAQSRARVLDDRELAAVWRAAGELGWPFGEITKLLILTAARRSEVAGMRWSELDLERTALDPSRPSAPRPTAHTSCRCRRPRSTIIEGLPRVDSSPWVFPARDGPGHATGLRAREEAARPAVAASPAGATTTCGEPRPAAWPGSATRRTSSAPCSTTARPRCSA